jgi:intracellular sulfur oxidation DsrE/DsrF family protein
MTAPHAAALNRRDLMVTAAAGGLALAAGAAAAAPAHVTIDQIKKEAEVACLYHCDYGDHERFAQTLNNIGNHYSVYGADPFALEITLIVHAGGIKFFLDSLEGTQWADETIPPELFERATALSKNGLTVRLCEITFKRNKIDPSRARNGEFITFVPSGVAAVAALQAKGFAYLKVG